MTGGRGTGPVGVTVDRAALEPSGEVVGERTLVRRVGWLAALAQSMATQVLTERWTGSALTDLASGKSGDGRALPAKGWMAVRRLGWGCTAPAGVYVPERVRRIAEEQAARALRLALHRRAVLAAVCATWPVDPAQALGGRVAGVARGAARRDGCGGDP